MNLKNRLTLIIFLATLPLFSQTEEIMFTGEFINTPLSEIVSTIEQKHGIRFYFNPKSVDNVSVTYSCIATPLTKVLDDILSVHGINYYMLASGDIVFTGEFRIIKNSNEITPDPNSIYTSVTDTLPKNYQKNGSTLIEIGKPSGDNRGKVVLSGIVRNIENGEPVIGAVVKIEELGIGAMTNQYGYYTLTTPKGNFITEFSCLGMKNLTQQVSIYSDGTLDIELKENLIPLGSVTVTAEKNSMLFRSEAGLEKLDVRTIKLIPSSMGEPDLIKVALFLPGVQTVGEGSAGFHVRGGSSDQNLVLLYDVPLFNTSHFFGFFPAVNSNVIGDVSLYKGGIPAKYGGKISAVLDVVPRDGNKKEFGGNGGISILTSHLLFEGPIIKDRTSFLFAGRTTYSNWVLKLLDDPQLSKSSASFYDSNIRLVHEVNKDNNIELSAYLSHDSFSFRNDTLYGYDNSIVSLKWRHIFSNRLFGVLALNNSNYNYNITSDGDKFSSFSLQHKVNYAEIKGRLTLYPNNNHQIETGIDIVNYNISPGQLLPVGDSSLIIKEILSRQIAIAPSIFISDEIKITRNLQLYAGVRLSSFLALGPASVHKYHPDFTRGLSTVTDTINYESGKIIKAYFDPEVRLAVNYLVGGNHSIKLNYNNTAQYIHQISNSSSISPTDIWVLSDTYLKPIKGRQLALGFYSNLLNNSLEISVEGYFKEIRNMIDFKGGSKLLLNHNLETDFVNVLGKAHGIELMAKKTKGKLNGWISYTYSRIMIKSIGNFPEEEINESNYFPANFDKPHDLSVVFNYIYSRRFSFSSTYTYSTGRPITYPVGAYTYGGKNILHYSNRNQFRIPDYSRLDLSMTIDGNLKTKKLAHSTFTFGVYNLLGRDNVYSIYFQTEHNVVKGYKLSIFARPIPSISYNFKF